MGYSYSHIKYFFELTRENFSQCSFLDLGSQDVTVNCEEDFVSLQRLVSDYGGNGDEIKTAQNYFPTTVSARDLLLAVKIKYTAFDVDSRPGTQYLDYNTLAFDRSLYGKFDIVSNAGTTEHLANPISAFFLMHYCCKSGGLLYNEVPLCGWANHGLNNLTPKFWHTLKWMNSYDVVSAVVKYVPVGYDRDGNFLADHLNFIKNLDRAIENSATVEVIFRKTQSRGFIPPFDAVVDDPKDVMGLVLGSLKPFVAMGALTQRQAISSVNDFMEFQQSPFRFADSGRIKKIWLRARLRSLLSKLIERQSYF